MLAFHGVSVAEEQVHQLLGELDADAIIDCLLVLRRLRRPSPCPLFQDIEDQLIALGIIDSDKLFANPDS